MHQALHAPVAITTLLVLLVAQTGCVTARKYRMIGEKATPAAGLNYTAETTGLKLVLATVIVRDGPGSWKQRALWDE